MPERALPDEEPRYGEMIRDLGEGLVLRRGRPEDVEALAAFNARVHEDKSVGNLIRDHALGRLWPGMTAADFTIVEEVATGAIVSSLCLIPRRWAYGGIEFPLGQPEFVGTLPEFRRRSLIRAQLDTVHAWSERRGDLAQVILGIPHFYRQFGYEMCVAHHARRVGVRPSPPRAGTTFPYRLRPATDADLPLMRSLAERAFARYLVTPADGEALWRYELHPSPEHAPHVGQWRVIESEAGEAVGMLRHEPVLQGGSFVVACYEVRPGLSWLAINPSVLEYIRQTGEEYQAAGRVAEWARDKPLFTSMAFDLGTEHPAYQVMPQSLVEPGPPYAHYLRVPDLPRFLQHVAPVLERRLAASPAVGHTGTLRLGFYGQGYPFTCSKGAWSRWRRCET